MIVCFSGTGNSLSVARMLASYLHENLVRIDSGFLDRPHIDVKSGRVIWVFPVYSWGVPPVVRMAIAKTSVSDSAAIHHAVMTCGDDVGLADRMFRDDIVSRGWLVGGAWSVVMPNTYVLLPGFDVDRRDVAAAKIKAAPRRVENVAEVIAGGNCDVDVVRGRFAWLKTHVIYPWFVRHAMSPKPFHATSACNGCGKCAAKCPLDNIHIQNRHPVWGAGCAMCLGCYHGCPRHAVAYGKATRSKGQYAG